MTKRVRKSSVKTFCCQKKETSQLSKSTAGIAVAIKTHCSKSSVSVLADILKTVKSAEDAFIFI